MLFNLVPVNMFFCLLDTSVRPASEKLLGNCVSNKLKLLGVILNVQE